jgi:hypothetical protein
MMTPNELKRTLPISVSLSLEEEMSIIRKWCLWEPKSVMVMLEHPEGNCPHPLTCRHWVSCDTLSCVDSDKHQ